MSTSLITLALAAATCGFTITNCISYVFATLPEKVPLAKLNSANAIVLIGCNLGVASAPLVLTLIDQLHTSLTTSFYVFGALYLSLASATLFTRLRKIAPK